MNQPIHNSSAKEPIYEKLKESHRKILEASDTWNWDTLTSLTTPGLQRVLHLDEIYQLSINNPGDIFEFGCHYGASTVLLNNLKYIYEPYSSRKIHTFDTFQGFPKLDKDKDSSTTNILNNSGDYGINISNYHELIREILLAHESLYLSVSSKSSFSINKGSIEKTLTEFLEKNRSVIASLVIFDMDLYKPTLDALELIHPHLINGSIIVFDEILAYDQYPGEALALKDCSYRKNLIPKKRSHKVHGASIFEYQK